MTYFFFAPLFIPFFILGVPIVDMAFAFVRRTARGHGLRHPGQGPHPPPPAPAGPRPPAERAHPVGLDGLLSGFVLFPLFVHQVNAFIPFGAVALGVGLYTLFHPGLRRGNGEEEDAQPDVGKGPPPEEPRRVSEVVRFPS